MTRIEMKTNTHPTEIALADYLNKSLSSEDKERIELHAAACEECLLKIVSAYESVESFGKNKVSKNGKDKIMKKINFYLILAIVSFALSFAMPQYFLQFLVATILLGIKWVADSKTTKMLVMIHEAWKNGGEKEVSRVIKEFDSVKKRF